MNPLEIEVANVLATGAPGAIDLGGRRLLVRAPSFSDAATLHRYASQAKRDKERRERESAQASLFRSLKDAGADQETLRLAFDTALNSKPKAMSKEELATEAAKAISPDEMNALIMSPEGAALLVWMFTRETHADITFEWLRKEITEDNYLLVLAQVGNATGLEDANPNGHGGNGISSPG